MAKRQQKKERLVLFGRNFGVGIIDYSDETYYLSHFESATSAIPNCEALSIDIGNGTVVVEDPSVPWLNSDPFHNYKDVWTKDLVAVLNDIPRHYGVNEEYKFDL